MAIGQTFLELYTAVLDLSPRQIATADAKNAVNRAYLAIRRLRPWFGLTIVDNFSTAADKTDGTVSVTNGSTAVVGVNTTFAASDAGRYLRIGSRAPLRIASFTSTTQITLSQAWGEANLSAQTYQILSLRYSLPSTAERVTRMTGPQWFLVRRSLGLIDAYDPIRQMRGVPLIFAEIENVSGTIEFELWPVPNSQDTYERAYRKYVSLLVADDDVPVLSSEPIMFRAQADQCKKLLGRTGDPSWATLASEYTRDYAEVLDAMIREDRKLRGSHPVVMDLEDSGINVWNTGMLAWQRAWSSLGLSSIATG